jgi:putative transposase
VKLGYRYRLYPTAAQADLLISEMERCRWVWNHARALREQVWRNERRTVGYGELSAALTIWRAGHEWLREGSSDAQQQTLRELCAAYARAWKAWRTRGRTGPLGLPGFRSRKRGRWQTVRYTRNGFTVREGRLRVKRAHDGVDVRFSRPLPSEPRTVTITRDWAGRWHASFRVDVEPTPLPVTGRMAGVDLGVDRAYALSDGHREPNPRHLRRRERALKRSQRAFAHKRKGSANRAKARALMARRHAKVADARRDWQQRQSTSLIRAFDLICIEDLAVAGMTATARGTLVRPGQRVRQKAGLNRSILDVGFASLRSMLVYKAELHGRELRIIERFHPSSKLCSGCGHAKAKLALSERTYRCDRCGIVLDRDVNAARNLLAAGLAESQNACGERVRPCVPRHAGQRPTKQEAPLATVGIPHV